MMDTNKDELDLLAVIAMAERQFQNFLILGYKAVRFIFKSWIIILILLIGGIVYGYFSDNAAPQLKQSKVLVRINFDGANYVYNSIALLKSKIKDSDTEFLNSIGFEEGPYHVADVEIQPVLNFTDIINNFQANDRNLEILLKNMEFDDDDMTINDMFTPVYNYYNMNITLSDAATQESVDRLFKYLNSSPLLSELRDESLAVMDEMIANNQRSIEMIDKIADTYIQKEGTTLTQNQVYVDKGLEVKQMFTTKLELQQEIEALKKEKVLSSDVAVVVGDTSVTKVRTKILDRKMVIYPIVLVFAFLLLAWIRHAYLYVKGLAASR